jgi:hypothetical protein
MEDEIKILVAKDGSLKQVVIVEGHPIDFPRPEWYSKKHCPGCWFYCIIVPGYDMGYDNCKMFNPEVMCKKIWHWEKNGEHEEKVFDPKVPEAEIFLRLD